MTFLKAKRRAVVTLVAVAVATLVAACTTTSAPPDGSEDVGGTLTLLITPEQQLGYEQFIESFEAETGIEVDLQVAPVDPLAQQLSVQLTSRSATDIFRVGVTGLTGVLDLADSADVADLSNEGWASRVPASFAPLLGDGGAIYAYPAGAQGIVTFYNKEVFETHGIEPPTTWSEFVAACEKLKSEGVTPIAMGLSGSAAHLVFLVYQFAITLVSNLEPEFAERQLAGDANFASSPGWNEAVDKAFSLFELGYVNDDPLGTPPERALQLVGSGQAAMIPLISGVLPALADTFENGADGIGVFALPATDDASQTWSPISPDINSLNANAENPAAARAFFEYMSDPSRTAAYAEAAGQVPALTGSDPVNTVVGVFLGKMLDSGLSAPQPHHYRWNFEVLQTLLASGQLVVAGEITELELLEQMDRAYVVPQ